jgi:hypothetical protein
MKSVWPIEASESSDLVASSSLVRRAPRITFRRKVWATGLDEPESEDLGKSHSGDASARVTENIARQRSPEGSGAPGTLQHALAETNDFLSPNALENKGPKGALKHTTRCAGARSLHNRRRKHKKLLKVIAHVCEGQ